MPDPDQPDFHADLPASALPWGAGERRQEQDRRQSDRKGKYDRRRNRCGRCTHFSPPEAPLPEALGACRFHQIPMAAEAFACPHFQPLRPDGSG